MYKLMKKLFLIISLKQQSSQNLHNQVQIKFYMEIENLIKGINLNYLNKKGLHNCNPNSLLIFKQKVPSSLINTPSSKTLSGFKFFEPGAKVTFSEHICKFLTIYFYYSSIFNINMKLFSYLFVQYKNSLYLCRDKHMQNMKVSGLMLLYVLLQIITLRYHLLLFITINLKEC